MENQRQHKKQSNARDASLEEEEGDRKELVRIHEEVDEDDDREVLGFQGILDDKDTLHEEVHLV